MFVASSSLKRQYAARSLQSDALPSCHAEVGQLAPVKCPPSPAPSQTPSPDHLPPWLRHTNNCQY